VKAFGSPARYYQGAGLLDQIGEFAEPLGTKAALVTDQDVAKIIGDRVEKSLYDKGISLTLAPFKGELTETNVGRLCAILEADKPDFIIAAGGGKGVDFGKAVAHRLNLNLMTVPTAASTDAPTSKIYVLYDDAHLITGVSHLRRNPDTVLIDTQILASAPPMLLRFGLGDAIAKRFEARQCSQVDGKNMFGHKPTITALAIAEKCYSVLRADAQAALNCAGSGQPTSAFENVVEATILMAGLGFESGGLSIAHALTRGLPLIPGLETAPHGFLISYGLMVQLKMETQSGKDHGELWDWLPKLGLPRNLEELGVTELPNASRWVEIAEKIQGAPHTTNFDRQIENGELIAAMRDPSPA